MDALRRSLGQSGGERRKPAGKPPARGGGKKTAAKAPAKKAPAKKRA